MIPMLLPSLWCVWLPTSFQTGKPETARAGMCTAMRAAVRNGPAVKHQLTQYQPCIFGLRFTLLEASNLWY